MYNRSKADYEYLSALLKPASSSSAAQPTATETKEVIIETAASPSPAAPPATEDEEDAKLVNIISQKAPAAMKKRVIRK